MLHNFLKITLRSLSKNKVYSMVNIIGLALGMTCSIIVFLWVFYEKSFDSYHSNAESIYRVVVKWKEVNQQYPKTPGKLAPVIAEEIPEIENAARYMKDSRNIINYGDETYYESNLSTVDPAFMEMFTFEFLEGNGSRLANSNASILISEKIAQKYFGDESPMGKTLRWNNSVDYKVDGVFKNLPDNSSFRVDIFFNHENVINGWPGGYSWFNFIHETFVQLSTGANPVMVADKIKNTIFINNPEVVEKIESINLQPLLDIHLDSNVSNDGIVAGDKNYVKLFTIIAFFILIIGCINFVNLATARALDRSKEVGIRKIAGANRWQLTAHFMGETSIMVLIAFVLTMLCIQLLLPQLNDIWGPQITLEILIQKFIYIIAGVIFFTIILSGLYPAMMLSAFSPMAIFKKLTKQGTRGGILRNLLVIFQFTIAIILIIGTLMVNRQLQYIQNKNLGFDKENIIYIPIKENIGLRYNSFKQELMSHVAVKKVAIQNSLPMTSIDQHMASLRKNPTEEIPLELSAIDYDYFDLMNIDIIEGRNFSIDHRVDMDSSLIINAETARLLNMKNINEASLIIGESELNLIGMVENSNFKSLHHVINPQAYYLVDDLNTMVMKLYGIILIKLNGENMQDALAFVENTWNKFNEKTPFEYHFLDQSIEQQYDYEKKGGEIFTYFSIVAILLSCLGLYGLATYTTIHRTKEIGIRKVLGSSQLGIILLINKHYVKLILLASVISFPAAFYACREWLAAFAYHTELHWMLFLSGGLVTMITALVTVSFRTIKISMINPAKSLRSE